MLKSFEWRWTVMLAFSKVHWSLWVQIPVWLLKREKPDDQKQVGEGASNIQAGVWFMCANRKAENHRRGRKCNQRRQNQNEHEALTQEPPTGWQIQTENTTDKKTKRSEIISSTEITTEQTHNCHRAFKLSSLISWHPVSSAKYWKNTMLYNTSITEDTNTTWQVSSRLFYPETSLSDRHRLQVSVPETLKTVCWCWWALFFFTLGLCSFEWAAQGVTAAHGLTGAPTWAGSVSVRMFRWF